MKVSKWVDLGAEVEVGIGLTDIAATIMEAFSRTADEIDEPSRRDVEKFLNDVAALLNAFDADLISLLSVSARDIVINCLRSTAGRFEAILRPAEGAQGGAK